MHMFKAYNWSDESRAPENGSVLEDLVAVVVVVPYEKFMLLENCSVNFSTFSKLD